jgi:hypothetical protein
MSKLRHKLAGVIAIADAVASTSSQETTWCSRGEHQDPSPALGSRAAMRLVVAEGGIYWTR